MIWIFMVAVFVATLLILRWHDKRKSPEEKQAEEERLQREREAMEEAWTARKKRTEIVEVKYLGSGMTRQKRGGLGGALLGGFFGGPLGAVVGAAIPKNAEDLQRFAVKYGDGRVVIREVHRNSLEYKKLMERVKWEEI